MARAGLSVQPRSRLEAQASERGQARARQSHVRPPKRNTSPAHPKSVPVTFHPLACMIRCLSLQTGISLYCCTINSNSQDPCMELAEVLLQKRLCVCPLRHALHNVPGVQGWIPCQVSAPGCTLIAALRRKFAHEE